MSDDNKLFVAVKVGMVAEVQVYNFNGLFLNSFGNGILQIVNDLTATDSKGGKIMVLGHDTDLSAHHFVYEFSEEGHLSQFDSFFQFSRRICFLHKTEHVAVLARSVLVANVPSSLKLHSKNGDFVRKINLTLSDE